MSSTSENILTDKVVNTNDHAGQPLEKKRQIPIPFELVILGGVKADHRPAEGGF